MTWLWTTVLGCAALPPELARPNKVAIGADGSVYVSDFHHDRIVVLNADGDPLRWFGRQGIGRNELWRVTAMSVDPEGALVIANRRPASDAAESATRFELIRFVDGEEVERIPLDGRTLQGGGWIDGVVRGRGDRWIVADSANGELVEVDRDGQRMGTFGGIPRPDAAPSALAREGDTVWVLEQHRHRVTRISAGGVREPLELQDAGQGLPRFPSALGVCPGEWLAVADYGGHRVQRFASDGSFLGSFAPAPAGKDRPLQLMDLAVSPDCQRLYLVDSKGDRLLVTTPEGELLREVHAW
jgi:sugar lactone lactonase YvrE